MDTSVDSSFPVLGVAAWSGTGKTTLLAKLLPRLRSQGLNVGVIKHAHHCFDIDKPGKDSHTLRQAGATPVLIASRQRFALMQETPGQKEPDLRHLLTVMQAHQPDLVLVEGFKAWPIPKLVLYREGIGDPAIMTDEWACAVATDNERPSTLGAEIAHLSMGDVDAIAEWVIRWSNTQHRHTAF